MAGEQVENTDPDVSAARCGAAILIARANEELDGALRAEALENDAENQTHGSHDASRIGFADSRDYSSYGEASRAARSARLAAVTPRSMNCGECLGRASVTGDGVKAGRCVLTFGCERSWAEQHPEFYDPARHDPHNTPKEPVKPQILPCAESGCSAVHRMLSPEGKILAKPELIAGQCGVDAMGLGWRERGEDAWENEELQAPRGDELPAFDGVIVTEADAAAAEAYIIAAAREEG